MMLPKNKALVSARAQWGLSETSSVRETREENNAFTEKPGVYVRNAILFYAVIKTCFK